MQRLEKLKAQFDAMYVDAFVVTNHINIKYLTGFNLNEAMAAF